MIEIGKEPLISLAEATRYLPRRRRGKKAVPSTIYRWASRGLRGVKLETLRVGGTLCTSQQALQRFFDKLSEADEVASSTDPPQPPAFGRGVEDELDHLGI